MTCTDENFGKHSPEELRKLAWDHVDLDNAVIHVWRSASRTGDVKTPKSKRSLVLPLRAVIALQQHRKRQAAERLAAGATWQDSNLVFCHQDTVFGDSDPADDSDGEPGRSLIEAS